MKELNFTQGTQSLLEKTDGNDNQLDLIKSRISEFFKLKNVYFLFGSGTSNGAIPVMKDLFQKVQGKVKTLSKPIQAIFDDVNLNNPNDFEELLGILYSQRNFLLSQKKVDKSNLKNCDALINEIEETIFEEINVDMKSSSAIAALDIYKKFYQKVSLRNKDLSRINVFTTNNDLFNETALDSININYINGFNGGLNKYFNPALFNYAFSKRMDTSIDKYEPVENMIYLYKLHGSINWIEDSSNNNSFFDVKEIVSEIKYTTAHNILIYPTPTKQDKSLGSPYTELFREFQKKLLEQHSVLFIIGYGFNDSHVNNIIHQALATNSSINIVIFKEPNSKIKLSQVDDSRIFSIWGNYDDGTGKRKINHFETIVDKLIPDLNQYKENGDILLKFIENIKSN